MSEKRYMVPEGMKAAIAPVFRKWFNCGSHHGELEEILLPAIQWLAEHPISFTTEQIQSARQKACMGGHLAENYGRVFEELQRRMFLAPEPEPEEIADLLWKDRGVPIDVMVVDPQGKKMTSNERVIEAYNRGKKFK